MALKDVTYAPELIQAALRYKNGNFIARSILPPQPVTDEDGIYMVELSTIPFTSLAGLARGDHAVAAELTEGADSSTYQLEGWALRRFTSDRERRRAKGGFAKWLNDAGLRLEGLLQLRYEVAVAAQVNSYAVITNAGAGSTSPAISWDAPNANIIEDIHTAKETAGILGNLNAIAINDVVYHRMQRNASLKETLGFDKGRQGNKLLSIDELKAALEVEYIFVSNAKVKSAAGAFTRIWGNHCLLFACDPTGANIDAVLGNSFVLSDGQHQNGIKAVQYPDAENRGGGGVWWELEDMVDPVLIAPTTAAFLYTSVIF